MNHKQVDAQIRRGVHQLKQISDSHVQRGRPTWRGRVLASACVSILLITVMVTASMWPRHAEAGILFKHAKAALAMVDGWHTTEYRIDGQGTPQQFREFWVRGDQVRVETDDRLDIASGGRACVYRKDLATAAVFDTPPGYNDHLSTDLSLPSLIANHERNGFEVTDVEQTTSQDGKPLTKVTLHLDAPSQRLIIFFDRASSLPILFERFTDRTGPWTQVSYTVPDYPAHMVDSLFQPDFPPSVKVIDTDATPVVNGHNVILELCDRP